MDHIACNVYVCRMLEGHKSTDPGFTRDAAVALAVRGSRKVEGTGYQFTRDLLLKAVRAYMYIDIDMEKHV